MSRDNLAFSLLVVLFLVFSISATIGFLFNRFYPSLTISNLSQLFALAVPFFVILLFAYIFLRHRRVF